MNFDLLRAPFPPDRVHWRVGATNQNKSKGMALAYIDARDVRDRLDQVCDPDNWQNEFYAVGSKTCCRLGLRINDEWIWKSDGAGDTDFEGDKGAFSDALKRAAVAWGIGRYLYDLKAPWVAVEQRGRSYVIVESEMKRLHEVLPGVSDKPAPEPQTNKGAWHGPLGITPLKAKLKALAGDLDGCSDMSELDGIEAGYADALKQCERDLPTWYNGTADAIGVRQRLDAMRHQFKGALGDYGPDETVDGGMDDMGGMPVR